MRRLDKATETTLAVYVHTATAHEPGQHLWAFSQAIEGVAWVACYVTVGIVAAHSPNAVPSTWTAPAGTTERVDL